MAFDASKLAAMDKLVQSRAPEYWAAGEKEAHSLLRDRDRASVIVLFHGDDPLANMWDLGLAILEQSSLSPTELQRNAFARGFQAVIENYVTSGHPR